MPFTPSAPGASDVPVITNKTLDTFQIQNVQINLSLDSPVASLSVTWCKGWVDEEDVFHVGETYSNTIEGANLEAAMAASVSGTLYEVIKGSLWTLMQTEGIVPVGSVS